MPFSKCSQYPVVSHISANGIKNLTQSYDLPQGLRVIRNFVYRDYWYFSQNYDLPQGTESNSRKSANNLRYLMFFAKYFLSKKE